MSFYTATYTGDEGNFTCVTDQHPISLLLWLNNIRNAKGSYTLTFYHEITQEDYLFWSVQGENMEDESGIKGFDLTTDHS